MRSKIKNTLPLFLAGLLLLAACTPEEVPADNRIYLDTEMRGSNGSKVALDGNSTYWMDDDEICLGWGLPTPDVDGGRFSVKYTPERRAYLSQDGAGTPLPCPSITDYLFAWFPQDLVELETAFFTNFIIHLDEGGEQDGIYYDPGDFANTNVTFPATQYWNVSSYMPSQPPFRPTRTFSSASIPMMSLIHKSQKRLYMRPIGSVIDVQLTNGFSGDVSLLIDSIVVTSNLNIHGYRVVAFYPGGEEAPKPRCYAFNYSTHDKFKRVILKRVGSNYSFTPGNSVNCPIALAPTDCLTNAGGNFPELTFHVYGFANDAPIHYTRTASLTRHLPAGAYFTAPITLDENNTGSSSIELLEDGDPIWSY